MIKVRTQISKQQRRAIFGLKNFMSTDCVDTILTQWVRAILAIVKEAV